MNEVFFFILLPLIAFMYASVGHGGASGYLALMALFSFATDDTKIIALTLNLFVAGIGFYQFNKNHHFKWSLFYPFAIGSIPSAFIGGMISINPFWYKKILGVVLFVAIIRLLIKPSEKEHMSHRNLFIALLTGAGIGFFSGMIGIGGGIILSPVILLLGWGNLKETAAVSALFIFVNSAVGLAGNLIVQTEMNLTTITLMSCIALSTIGGYAGSKWGSTIENIQGLKYVLAFVLVIACVKLWLI